jgi:hypothetical protein
LATDGTRYWLDMRGVACLQIDQAASDR